MWWIGGVYLFLYIEKGIFIYEVFEEGVVEKLLYYYEYDDF